MKKLFSFLFLFTAVVFSPGSIYGETAPENLQETAADEIPSLIIGKWAMLDENGSLKASLNFKDPHNYEMTEIHDDGTKVGRKGEYRLEAAAQPCAIDLCLEKCGAPGSEWTTRFGILRFLSEDNVEIRTSPSDTRPGGFDAADGEYTLILSREK